ncbi:hypothetical protein QDW23_gp29 [Microbacterium phage Stromboli]|uniref:hypothetical protein n=1 Tax=Microbacterium phage Stromboli TaxID=2713263 RepID=UPI00141725D0|nr:hypothetical protein QDW23_gp29 [Microbacterium phage Stromboli]QIN93688.1 hypothetical protein SEA_STROMBOLI_29 [Microbacterium phage Stromboli]
MNKFTARGLAMTAALEKRDILVVVDYHEVSETLREMANTIAPTEVRRANGAERITFPGGGRVIFRRPGGHGHRGVSVDTVFVDEPFARDRRLLEDLVPCVAASPRGELIRA